MWFSTSSGRIELNIPKRLVNVGYHQGQCDDAITYIRRTEKRIEKQLQAIDPELLKSELTEYGAWDDDELADHDANLDRTLWLACGDLAERIANPEMFKETM
jgi:hypothetical protein